MGTEFEFGFGLERELADFLCQKRHELAAIDRRLNPLVEELCDLVAAGGKRLRPLLVAWGYRAAGAVPDRRLCRVAAAVELLHSFALIQDDVIDRSPMRRGRAAAHVALARGCSRGDATHFGISAAILLSDLAFVWADELMLESGFKGPRLIAGQRVFTRLRLEVTAGQYLDLAAAHDARLAEEQALRVNRYKTASYTVQHPIQLGMALAGAPDQLIETVPGFAVPAGVAFQLRDDLLGVFGDERLTGKPAGQDLAEAKPTWLLARAWRRASPASRCELERLMADPCRLSSAQLAGVRRLLVSCGAVADAEALIDSLCAEARAAADLMPVAAGLRVELEALTHRLVSRAA